MIALKKKDIYGMKNAGNILNTVFFDIKEYVVENMNTLELDKIIFDKITRYGGKPSFLGYFAGGKVAYKYSSCISVNDTVIHGLPSKDIILKNGDKVSIDIGVYRNGYNSDATRIFFIGDTSEEVIKISKYVEKALENAISMAVIGKRVGDISQAIYDSRGEYGVILNATGHGIGKRLHELPYIPNYGLKGTGEKLKIGQCLAIEPIFSIGNGILKSDINGWNCKTENGKIGVHCEDTIMITDGVPEILTRF